MGGRWGWVALGCAGRKNSAEVVLSSIWEQISGLPRNFNKPYILLLGGGEDWASSDKDSAVVGTCLTPCGTIAGKCCTRMLQGI
jgi:hypothetical protein